MRSYLIWVRSAIWAPVDCHTKDANGFSCAGLNIRIVISNPCHRTEFDMSKPQSQRSSGALCSGLTECACDIVRQNLRMSARGDLRNLLSKERRLNKGRVPWESVELSPDAGKYLGRDDDPSLPLRLAEEKQTNASAIGDSVPPGLSEQDLRALELMVQGERRTSVFAEVYGLCELSAKEQRGDPSADDD